MHSTVGGMDKALTYIVLLLDRVWTDLVPGQTLDRPWTDPGQRLDKVWISCPVVVQGLSDHTMIRSTQYGWCFVSEETAKDCQDYSRQPKFIW